MTAHTRLDPPLVESIRKALTGHALPGETHGLTREAEREAAEFLAQVAARRKPGEVEIAIQSTGGEAGHRRMRIGIVNDDMPFLVNSVANAIARRQITIHRLLHPVVCVNRDDKGALHDVELLCSDKKRRKSMMYLELDRVDARDRQELAADLKRVLDDVRLAVRDWPKLQGKMREDAKGIADPEGARAARLVCRRRHDLARLSCRKALRSAVRTRSASSAFPARRPTKAAASTPCAISKAAAISR